MSCQNISKAYAGRSLFQDLSLSVFAKDRIGLVGLNGSGKSTLLKILLGLELPDFGVVAPRRGLRIGYVPQGCEFPNLSPQEILMNALPVETPQYEKERLAKTQLSQLGFSDHELMASSLSGGWKKRLSIGAELIKSPDLLLLDEPTNHLDLEGILWLETFLAKDAPTYLVISHDRYFLQHVTNRIIEMDKLYPKGIIAIDGPYTEFLVHKEAFLQGQLQQERRIATKARRETKWLQAGVKARTTKSQSRIDEAGEILEEYASIQARNLQKRAKIDFAATERETRKLLVAKNLSKEMGEKTLFRNLDFTLSPGSRLGLMGPNGSGKTSLLKMLAGEMAPDCGTIKKAEGLQVVYFDQHRAQLPLHLTLKEALSPKGDFVSFQGAEIHVNGWCKRFLFSPDLLEMTIENLSGGERARIAIAHLMLQPADILLLDEPTNDLDIPTLEALEESLLEFPGALVLISHDRYMLDRICNSVLALGNPDQVELFASYSQWEASTKNKTLSKKEPSEPRASSISYAEKKELEGIERKIAKLEKELSSFNHLLEEKEIAEDAARLSEICNAIRLVETEIEQLYLRWEELYQR
ncbi:MAG TPA: ABC-F family ATP-binding cassette domain-containing protein [Chlamydiales bacterium]|nr:ABC-F family ATP-binding cassette domain-containing protein [Chlamydiales bacterium]